MKKNKAPMAAINEYPGDGNHFFATSASPARSSARALLVVSSLMAGLGIGGCVGDADMSEPTSSDPAAPPRAGEGIATLRMTGIALTTEQAEALEEAYAGIPHLSTEQALDVIEATADTLPSYSPQSSGEDSATNNCSTIYLWGDSDGNYLFTQAVFTSVGEPQFGEIAISTDGWFTTTSTHDLTFAEPYHSFEGTLAWTGVDAEATLMDGWMVTTGLYFCTGELDALWE
jgi:hypothetical protein